MSGSSSPIEAPLLSSVNKPDEKDLERTTIQKLNWRVSPFCAFITILAYIDRGNLGFAAGKVCHDLDLSHSEYGLGASLFFVGYVFSQIPSNILLKRFGPNRWLAFLLIAWGITASSLAFVQNRTQFYVLRFVLGLAEGGCFPGVWYYITLFFPNMWIAAPYALIAASLQFASPASAPLAAGFLALDGHLGGIDGWRLLFFVEGVIPVIYGALIHWVLPSSPSKASFLTDQEKSWLDFKLKENQQVITVTVAEQFKTVLKSIDFWRITMYVFFHFIVLNIGLYWTTLIIGDTLNGDEEDDDDDTCASSKSTGAVAVMLTTIPFTMCAFLCIYMGNISPRLKNRPVTSAIITATGVIFWIMWVVSRHHSFAVALLALGCALSAVNMPSAVVLGIFTSYFDTRTKAAALSALNTISSFSGIIGPIIVGILVDDYGYGVAVAFLAVTTAISAILLYYAKDPFHRPTLENGRPDESIEA